MKRKGSARYKILAEGRPAHSGSKHEYGRSAIKEMSRIVCEIESWTDYDRGITFNAGVIEGGSGVNVVPQYCRIDLDNRFEKLEDGQEYEARIYSIKPSDIDIKLTVTGSIMRPPMEATYASLNLFEKVQAFSREHGFTMDHTNRTGGGSDGNLAAAEGVPTLDGLGADGYGAHQLDEHIYISSLEPRIRTWMKIFERLD